MFRAVGPMLEVARIQSEINRLFDNLLEIGETSTEPRAWMPNADISEGEDEFVVRVEIPGVSLTDLHLSVDGGNIIIRGEKKTPMAEQITQQHLLERSYGGFERIVTLAAPVNTHRATALLRNGVLKIIFPKVSNRRGGEVQIPVSEG